MNDSTVAKSQPILSTDDLTEMGSFEDALALLERAGIGIVESTQFGDGFDVQDKAEFVNVPFVILDYKFAEGDYSDDFSITRIMTADGRKAVLTDGSTGICAQLRRLDAKGVHGGVIVRKGLVASEYDYVDEKGKKTPAVTYYLSGM